MNKTTFSLGFTGLDLANNNPAFRKSERSQKYILVLDLDETLVHFKETARQYINDHQKLKVRPGVQ